MLCGLILYMSGATYSLTSTPNDRFLGDFFIVGLFSLGVLARNMLTGNRRRNIFFFSYFVFDADLEYDPMCYV